jgi:DNA polymerase-1
MVKAPKKRLVLLDSHAIIHRAYHALYAAELTGPSGEPTGALYGLISILLKIVADLSPDYLAACYDLPKPTIRHEAYEGYKGTRKETDDALARQLQESHKVFEAFGIPMYEKEGFEADDLLGTIAHQLADDPEVEIIIASGDMDTLQLVDKKRVRVFMPKKSLNDTALYDEAAVEERFSFGPSLIPDYKGLRGDPSDNIPGVPGIGEKTATELVTGFGSVEDIYMLLEKKGDEPFLKKGVKARTLKLLREHEESARLSKALATIRLDAPIAFALPKAAWQDTLDLEKVYAMCDTFGFRTLRARVKTLFAREAAIAAAIAEPEEEIDETRFREAQAMLWLISSEFTNPSLDDILAFAKEQSFDAAYAELKKQLAALGRVGEVYGEIEQPLIGVIKKMEARGVLVDPTVLAALSEKYRAELEKIEESIYEHAGRAFNVSSPKQLGEVLFDELHITPERQKRTAGGARSTRESELEKIRDAHPIVGDVLEYRELKKLLSTYIDNLPPLLDEAHRLHAEFVQTGTTTGRMASQNPNLQNIPLHSERGRAIRHAFVATPRYALLALDYSQIELRLAAILSGDPKLCAIFKDGRDVHREVAARVFGVAPEEVDDEMRRRAKVINFGILYGMGINALKAQLGTTTAETHAFYEAYFGQFTRLAEYLESTKGFARKNGYTETLFGRRRQFPEMKSALPYVRAQAERMAINAPIQGTQADIIKLAMVRVDEMLSGEGAVDDAYLLLQVHDELVYEIQETRLAELGAKIRAIMESVLTPEAACGVPITTTMKAGSDWGAMQAV